METTPQLPFWEKDSPKLTQPITYISTEKSVIHTKYIYIRALVSHELFHFGACIKTDIVSNALAGDKDMVCLICYCSCFMKCFAFTS